MTSITIARLPALLRWPEYLRIMTYAVAQKGDGRRSPSAHYVSSTDVVVEPHRGTALTWFHVRGVVISQMAAGVKLPSRFSCRPMDNVALVGPFGR